MPIIRDLLQNIRETISGTTTGGGEPNDPEAGTTANPLSSERHQLIEDFMQKRGRFLQWVPFILVVSIANSNILAAVWSAWGVCLFINLLDFYRSRYNPKVAFPMVMSASSLAAYTLVIILVYAQNPLPPNFSQFIGPIVVTFLFGGIIFSMIFQNPMTMQTTGPSVDDATRASPEFLAFNQLLTGYILFWFGLMMIFIWCGNLIYPKDSAGQIILGIVFPILCPLIAVLTVPLVANYIKSKHSVNKKEDEQSLIRE